MRIPRLHFRPRLRLRTLLIAVAVAAVLMAAYRLNGVSVDRRQAAMKCEMVASESMENAAQLEREGRGELAGQYRRKAAFYAAHRQRYERAARYPWLPVPRGPDWGDESF